MNLTGTVPVKCLFVKNFINFKYLKPINAVVRIFENVEQKS